MINPDGTGFREITSGSDNNAFPSMSPDGTRVVFRSFAQSGSGGLKIINLETKAVTNLTSGYDNFPLWSPRGDLIMFTRLAAGSYAIWTVKPDGSGAKQLTSTRGNDAHQGWSPMASASCSRARAWASRTKRSIPTRRSRMASSS